MIAAFLRILLLLLPLVAVLMWLRWRMRKDRTEEELQHEIANFRKVMGLLILVAIAAGVGLKLTDENTGDPRTKYIPPHTENGQVVPGRFVPVDEEPKDAPEDPKGSTEDTDTESDGQREQNPG